MTVDELDLWDKVSRKMFVSIQPDGIINQFEGHEKLEEFPWKKDGKLDHKVVNQVLEQQGGQLNQYKVSKQADVLMLFYLFSTEELKELLERIGYKFDSSMIPLNILHYTPQMAHNSTLSRITHAWVLSRLDRANAWKLLYGVNTKPISEKLTEQNFLPNSWDMFLEALSSDYFDIQGGSTPEGIHIGAMAGTLDIVQRCYTGLVIKDHILWLDPKLPDSVKRLSFNIRFRKQSLRIEITHAEAVITALQALAEPIRIAFAGKVHELTNSQSLRFSLINEPQQELNSTK
ncbi:MAG: glycoside hydrolase family 65 protein, partial [Cyanobacteria bacterium SZAS-4]|nr:glycoside hydrolase family 65 protein [Cyanobacteria bacterium SZAS-4]